MDRKEVAKAASQTEDAEKSLNALRESYMEYKAQSTQQVSYLKKFKKSCPQYKKSKITAKFRGNHE